MRSIGVGLYVLISNYHWGKKKSDKVWIFLGAEMLRFIFSVIRLPCYPSRAPSQRKEWKAQGGIIFLTNIYQSKQETLNAKLKHNHKVNFKLRKGHKKNMDLLRIKKKKTLSKIARDQNREGLWKEKNIARKDCFSKWFGIEIMYIAQIQTLRTR